jgi:hypothetical protein
MNRPDPVGTPERRPLDSRERIPNLAQLRRLLEEIQESHRPFLEPSRPRPDMQEQP